MDEKFKGVYDENDNLVEGFEVKGTDIMDELDPEEYKIREQEANEY